MRLSELLVVYLCIGLAVAAASRGSQRWLALPLWPLVLPSLLSAGARFDTAPPAVAPAVPEVDAALARVSEALALWHAAPPLPLDALRRALGDLESRRGSLAALLARPEYRPPSPGDAAAAAAWDQRRANVAALARLHEQLGGELSAALARLDELATRIQLAHFSGGPLGDVAEQLSALVAAVEGARSAQAEVEGS